MKTPEQLYVVAKDTQCVGVNTMSEAPSSLRGKPSVAAPHVPGNSGGYKVNGWVIPK